MKYLRAIILTLAICCISFAGDNNLISKVKNKYDKITTIQGNFSQTICSENLGTCQQFEGKFSISRPYYSRLEVKQPEKQLIVSNSVNLYIHLVNKKKVYIQSANAGFNFFKIFDMFLNDTARFVISKKDSVYSILAYQKDSLEQSHMFEGLTLHINRKTNLIEQFSFIDMNDSEMKFELTNITVNPKLSNKTFKFDIPKGVEIIRY